MKGQFMYPAFLLFLLLTGCDLLNPDNDDTSITPLEGKMQLAFYESYTGYNEVEEPSLFLQLRTEKDYPCINYRIAAVLQESDKRVYIRVYGVTIGGICLTAIGPARTVMDFKNFKEGNYTFALKGDKFSDVLTLSIHNEIITLSYGDIYNSVVRDSVWRFPVNSFVLEYDPQYVAPVISEGFIDTLKGITNISEFNFPDYDSNPYLIKDSPFNNYVKSDTMRFFKYTAESDFDLIEDVLKKYKQKYFPQNEIYLRLSNWMNKKIISADL